MVGKWCRLYIYIYIYKMGASFTLMAWFSNIIIAFMIVLTFIFLIIKYEHKKLIF
jgi:hypothetical protein